MSLEEQIEIFTQNLVTKNNLPSWFHRTIKDLISKNVTIEEWNTFTQYISNNASDIKSIEEFVLILAEYIEGYCSKDYVDEQCADTLASAKSYADNAANEVKLIPHRIQFTSTDYPSYTDRYISFYHKSTTPLTKSEFIEYIKKVKCLPFSNSYPDELGLPLYIVWPIIEEDLLEVKRAYISNSHIFIDNDELTPEEFEIVDEVIDI